MQFEKDQDFTYAWQALIDDAAKFAQGNLSRKDWLKGAIAFANTLEENKVTVPVSYVSDDNDPLSCRVHVVPQTLPLENIGRAVNDVAKHFKELNSELLP